MTQAVSLAALGSYGGVLLPSWTTAARPTPAYTGQQGYNTTLGTAEFYNGTAWVQSTLTSGTAVSASGTSVTFSSIPAWVKRITVLSQGLSTNGTSNIQIQLGTSGGFVTSGYLGSCSFAGATNSCGGSNFTAGLPLGTNGSGDVRHGSVVINNITSNTWVATGISAQSNNTYSQFSGGSIVLSGTLTQLKIMTANGTDTFSAGTFNILYE